MIKLRQTPFVAADEIAAFHTSQNGAGAIVTFTGSVRGEDRDDPVLALELEAHPELTLKFISDIAAQARSRWALIDVMIVHRTGRVGAGEDIVTVGTAARHRRDAFEAADFLMDNLKSRVPLWKKEMRQSGSHWIEPRAADYKDAARWTKDI